MGVVSHPPNSSPVHRCRHRGHVAAGRRPLAGEGEWSWRRKWRGRWPACGTAKSPGCRASRAAGPCTSAGASAADARTGSCTGGSCRDCGALGPCSPSTWRPPSWRRTVRPPGSGARAAGEGSGLHPCTETALHPGNGPRLRPPVSAYSFGASPVSALSCVIGLWFLLGELS